MSFLETPRFPQAIALGSKGGPRYATRVVSSASGAEKRNSAWTYPRHAYNVGYGIKAQAQYEILLAYFHAVGGRAHGFRFQDPSDHKSCAASAHPAATDQLLGSGTGALTTFQLKKTYTQGSLNRARKISKPVTSSVLVAIGGKMDNRWTVDTTTGLITFSANIAKTISGITKAAQAVITTTTAHGLVQGSSAQISGISGMTQINGLRGVVTQVVDSTHVEVDIDSRTFGTYTSGGTLSTLPQTGEEVRAGFEFDVPVRFDSDELDGVWEQPTGSGSLLVSSDVTLLELRL